MFTLFCYSHPCQNVSCQIKLIYIKLKIHQLCFACLGNLALNSVTTVHLTFIFNKGIVSTDDKNVCIM